MIKERGRSKSRARSVLEGVVEVPAGTGLGASFKVRDIIPLNEAASPTGAPATCQC